MTVVVLTTCTFKHLIPFPLLSYRIVCAARETRVRGKLVTNKGMLSDFQSEQNKISEAYRRRKTAQVCEI